MSANVIVGFCRALFKSVSPTSRRNTPPLCVLSLILFLLIYLVVCRQPDSRISKRQRRVGYITAMFRQRLWISGMSSLAVISTPSRSLSVKPLVISSDMLLRHRPTSYHPECPERIEGKHRPHSYNTCFIPFVLPKYPDIHTLLTISLPSLPYIRPSPTSPVLQSMFKGSSTNGNGRNHSTSQTIRRIESNATSTST